MPIGKDNKKYCVNHPDEELIAANEHNEKWVHFVFLATEMESNLYDVGMQKGTAMIFYSCPICGYSEAYLSKDEIDNLGKKV